MKEKKRIIIFDGICGLCNKSIDILIKLDTQKRFKYTSNQGEFVKTLDIEPDMDSIIYNENGIIYYKRPKVHTNNQIVSLDLYNFKRLLSFTDEATKELYKRGILQ